mgnify:CR=1 FL=1|jgi:hypothetical protein|tara:strand:+ start:587 stop:790 length:204 start_codon:yes stop_codon:yes gene_type:complete
MSKEINWKHIHDINTFSCSDNEVYLSAKDEEGEEITLVFSAFEFLSWIGKDEIEYIKEQTIKHIKEL